MSVGENIRKKRLELGMSQQELADALGYKTRSSITKIEKGTAELPNSKLSSFANYLNTTVEYLLSGTEPAEERGRKNLVVPQKELFMTGAKSTDEKGKCIAVILAGGKYRTNRRKIPFQFVSVEEKPIILYTMEVYQKHPTIDEIYVVCLEGWEDILPTYVERFGITKYKGVIPAGNRGISSVKNAVEWLTPHCRLNDVIILQESTRPLIDHEIVSNVISCCKLHGSAVSFTYLEDTTPFMLNERAGSVTYLDASMLITLQSPEAYTLGYLRYAFLEAGRIGHDLNETVCAVFLHNLGRELTFCESSRSNMRIVCEDDLKLFRALLRAGLSDGPL